jgi:predicted lipoprotein with Yx(FWY)xxD motif
MRRIALGFAALLVAGAAAFAAAKTMDTAAGKVWTDDKGMTLYTFDKDEKGKSNCCRGYQGGRRLDDRRPHRQYQDVGL